MSLEFIEGFDHYTATSQIPRKWDTGSTAIGIGTGRFAGNAVNQPSAGCTVTLTSVQTRVMGFAYNPAAMSAAIICQFMDAGTTQVEVRQTATGALTVTRNATVLATSTNVIAISTWYYIEFKAKIDPTTGTYELRVNGSSTGWCSGTGANTRNTANSTCNQVKIVGPATNNTLFDDLYALNTSGSVNNDFLGECRIYTSLPTGDGATTQWTLSTGATHFGTVDETTPNDDTDYNSSATVGQIDLLTFPSISPTGPVVAVQTVLTARKDDAGTRQIAEQCRSGGTIYTGAVTQTMNSTYAMFREIRETDPATSAAWTSSGVNNAQFGQKVIA